MLECCADICRACYPKRFRRSRNNSRKAVQRGCHSLHRATARKLAPEHLLSNAWSQCLSFFEGHQPFVVCFCSGAMLITRGSIPTLYSLSNAQHDTCVATRAQASPKPTELVGPPQPKLGRAQWVLCLCFVIVISGGRCVFFSVRSVGPVTSSAEPCPRPTVCLIPAQARLSKPTQLRQTRAQNLAYPPRLVKSSPRLVEPNPNLAERSPVLVEIILRLLRPPTCWGQMRPPSVRTQLESRGRLKNGTTDSQKCSTDAKARASWA